MKFKVLIEKIKGKKICQRTILNLAKLSYKNKGKIRICQEKKTWGMLIVHRTTLQKCSELESFTFEYLQTCKVLLQPLSNSSKK
jgi:hypothetical protein